jgi:hypothetical protein
LTGFPRAIYFFILSNSYFCISSIIWCYLLIETAVTILDTPSISSNISPPIIAFLKATFMPPTHHVYTLMNDTSKGKNTSCDETGDNCVPGVILLSVVYHQAIH